jgi:NADH-ubiquinone oxidoreductase chain 5
MFIGIGTPFFENSIFNLPKNVYIIDSEFIPFYIKLIPLFFSFLGIFILYLFNTKSFQKIFFKFFFLSKNHFLIKKSYLFFNKK